MARSFAVVMFFLFSGAAFAQSMDAHTHGLANLDVAVDGSELQLHFVSPADSIYGFEHDPMNASQRETVENALAVLQTPEWLIGELANQCEVTGSELVAGVSLTESHAHDEHEEHAAHDDHDSHDEHAAHEEHADEEHASHDGHADEEHASHDDHEHEADEQHSEVEARYSLSCESDVPASIAITAFTAFPAIEKLEVQWISASAQGGAELTAENATLNFDL